MEKYEVLAKLYVKASRETGVVGRAEVYTNWNAMRKDLREKAKTDPSVSRVLQFMEKHHYTVMENLGA